MLQASAAADQVYQRPACKVLPAWANELTAVSPPSRDEDPGDAFQAPSHAGTYWVPWDHLLSHKVRRSSTRLICFIFCSSYCMHNVRFSLQLLVSTTSILLFL